MPEINCIQIRDYAPFTYKGYKIENIWKGYNEDDIDAFFMFFDIINPNGKTIEFQTFSRSKTKKDLKKFVKDAINNNEYFMGGN